MGKASTLDVVTNMAACLVFLDRPLHNHDCGLRSSRKLWSPCLFNGKRYPFGPLPARFNARRILDFAIGRAICTSLKRSR